jgi:glc operon protein GlcG
MAQLYARDATPLAKGFDVNSEIAAALPSRLTLTLEAARAAAGAAEREAVDAGLTMCIAIVDDGGNLVLLERIDGTQFGSVDVAIAKARTAIAFRRATKIFEDRVAGGWNPMLGLPGVIPIEGGVPLTVAGQIVGAIGVSGGTPAQDGQVAGAGAMALASEG